MVSAEKKNIKLVCLLLDQSSMFWQNTSSISWDTKLLKVQGDIRDSLIHQRVLLTYNDLLWKKCRSAEGLKCF